MAEVIGVFMGAYRGLGYLLAAGQESDDAAAGLGVILVPSLVGWLFQDIVRAMERRLIARHPSLRDEGL